MRVVDTSALIEFFLDSAAGQRVQPLVPQRRDLVLPTMVLLELAKWVTRELDRHRAARVLAWTTTAWIVPLDTAIALSAAEISQGRRLATADAVIYATACHLGCDLLTCDAHFEGLEHVVYVPKA